MSLCKRLWTKLAAVALCCVLPPVHAETSAGKNPVGLLPDHGGPVTEAVISVNSARRATLRNAQLITNIVNAFPKRVKFTIVSNDPSAFTVASNPWPERIRFLHLPEDNPITIWTQDPFVVLKDEDKSTTLLTPKEFLRAQDSSMAVALAGQDAYEVSSSGLYFEGGNIVSDDEHVLIGANTIRRNAIRLESEETTVVMQLQEAFGRQVLVIGPFPQPVAHIDMVLTPLGERKIVVADARLGAAIAEQALKDEPDSVAMFEKHCEDYFFGDPSIRQLTASGGKVVTAPSIIGRTAEMVKMSRKIAPVLDGIAAALEQFDYQVYRMPFLFGGPESKPDARDSSALQATYPMLTYNNVIVEQAAGHDTVYLPAYGWPAMDQAAATQWRELGYRVRRVEGLTTSAMYGGSLRCAVKVLAREE